MIDTHCHLTDPAYEADLEKTLERANLGGVAAMITMGTDLVTSHNAVELAHTHPEIYAAVGIHPEESSKLYASRFTLRDTLTELNELLSHSKVVAVGEIGLDKHYESFSLPFCKSQGKHASRYTLQKEMLVEQVKLAYHYNKPVILHSRDVKQDVLDTLLELNLPVKGVFHCFEGSKHYLKRILDAGFYVSFTGNITYTHDRLLVASTVPLNKLLLETDSPLMTPQPHRGERNEPAYVRYIAEAHARSRGITVEEVVETTAQNARNLFTI